MWLINLVENLLSITRLVEGRLNLNITEDLVDDVVAEALRHVNKKSAEHTIVTESGEEFLLARMDPRLIVQVIINIVNNAIEYTPAGSHITIRSEKKDGTIILSHCRRWAWDPRSGKAQGIRYVLQRRESDRRQPAQLRHRSFPLPVHHRRPRGGADCFRQCAPWSSLYIYIASRGGTAS